MLNRLAKIVADTTELKEKLVKKELNAEITKEVHLQQNLEIEDLITEAAAEVIENQIREMATRLEEMDGNEKSVSDSAEALVSLVVNQSKWKQELVDKLFPVLAVKMAEASAAQWILWGVDRRRTNET